MSVLLRQHSADPIMYNSAYTHHHTLQQQHEQHEQSAEHEQRQKHHKRQVRRSQQQYNGHGGGGGRRINALAASTAAAVSVPCASRQVFGRNKANSITEFSHVCRALSPDTPPSESEDRLLGDTRTPRRTQETYPKGTLKRKINLFKNILYRRDIF
jgi:hypothetical protein